MKFLQFFSEKKVFANLIAVFLAVVGIGLFAISPKESLPEIKLGLIVINTVYPNAAPQEVEKLVTTSIEDAVKNIKGIDEITSSSSESNSVITLTLKPGVKDTTAFLNDVKNAVERVEGLPDDIEDPQVFEVTTDEFPVIQVAIAGKGNYAELRQEAGEFEEKILNISGVSSVQKVGFLDKTIWVEADTNKAKEFGITIFSLINSLRGRNLSMPAGNKVFDGSEYSLRAIAEIKDSRDVENVIIRSNEAGRYVRVKDVASVKPGFAENNYFIRANGENAVILTVLKSSNEDSVRIIDEIKRIGEAEKKKSGSGVNIFYTNDASKFIRDRLNVVGSNGLSGALLVLVILVILLRPSVAAMAALSLPVSLGASLIAIKLMGLSYNMLSLFGYVMVIGMLVDNAVVVSENVYRYIEKGHGVMKAVAEGAGEVFVPVLASTLTTIASFLPLVLVSGVLGSFLRPIPTVIIITLIVSFIQAYFILPSQLGSFVKPLKKKKNGMVERQNSWFFALRSAYGGILRKAIKKKKIMLVSIAVIFILSMYLGSLKGFQFFTTQVDEVQVKVKTNPAFSLAETGSVMSEMEKKLLNISEKDLDTVYTYTGRQESPGGLPDISANKGQFNIVLKLESERKTKDIDKVIKSVREILGKPEGVEEITISGVRREGGGARDDINITFTGNSYDYIKQAADEALSLVRGIKGITQIGTDLEEGKKEIRFIIDEKKAARTNVPISQIAIMLRASIAGIKVTSIKKQGEDIDVVVKLDEKNISSLKQLLSAGVSNTMGQVIPLRQLVKTEEGYSYTVLKHRDTKKSVSITGNIDKTAANVNAVNSEILKKIRPLEEKYPDIKISAGGEFKEMMKSFIELGIAFLIAMLLIYIILATLFNSFSQPFIIMLAIPFGFTGVMLTLFIHGMPMSFAAFMGFVALSGVVVNNSLILNDFVNKFNAKDCPYDESVIASAKIRLRPIILTTLTTAAGLLPLGYGILGNKDAFLQPVALVFAWGLLFSTLVTLFIIPIFLTIWNSLLVKLKLR